MAQNELQIVTFEQAKRLKVAGFDWIIDSSFFQAGNDFALGIGFGSANWNDREKHRYSAPTVALALKWFRDVKGLENSVKHYTDNMGGFAYRWDFNNLKKNMAGVELRLGSFESAESALLDALLTELEASKTACE